MLQKKSCRVKKIKLVVKTNTINTHKNLQMLHCPFSIHFCFTLGTVKPCFVSERVTRADPQTRNRFLRTILGSNDIFNPGFNRKTLIRKRTSILDTVCFNYEPLFYPIHCTACRKCQCSSRGKLLLPEGTGILSISDQFHYL